MYVDTSHSQGKYKRYLLRENFRENGKIKHRTIANLSKCSEEEISAIRLALKHKKDLSKLAAASEVISLHQGLSVGAVWLVFDMARELGIVDALGNSREGKIAGQSEILKGIMCLKYYDFFNFVDKSMNMSLHSNL